MKTFIIIAKGETKLSPSDIMDMLNHGEVPMLVDIVSVKEKSTKKQKRK